jgi:pyrroloquinoline quinone biosynthesis protein D
VTAAGIDAQSRPRLERRFRLQWEAAQKAHVLLYPEGMIKLNTSAGEILKRCDGAATIAEITADLETNFKASGLYADVVSFLELALSKHWIAVPP